MDRAVFGKRVSPAHTHTHKHMHYWLVHALLSERAFDAALLPDGCCTAATRDIYKMPLASRSAIRAARRFVWLQWGRAGIKGASLLWSGLADPVGFTSVSDASTCFPTLQRKGAVSGAQWKSWGDVDYYAGSGVYSFVVHTPVWASSSGKEQSPGEVKGDGVIIISTDSH